VLFRSQSQRRADQIEEADEPRGEEGIEVEKPIEHGAESLRNAGVTEPTMTDSETPPRTPAKQWFEDFRVGEAIDLGSRTVGRDEIVAFAAKWDPQPMHLEDAAGDASLLHGLSASGWHTGSLVMRMFCDNLLLGSSSLGSPGIDSLKWKRPVHPGDTLSVVLEVAEKRTSASRPRLGLVRGHFVVTNQRGETVMTMESTLMMGRREAA
jgi:acyl dehydratase